MVTAMIAQADNKSLRNFQGTCANAPSFVQQVKCRVHLKRELFYPVIKAVHVENHLATTFLPSVQNKKQTKIYQTMIKRLEDK
jgi:hypothetical protein